MYEVVMSLFLSFAVQFFFFFLKKTLKIPQTKLYFPFENRDWCHIQLKNKKKNHRNVVVLVYIKAEIFFGSNIYMYRRFHGSIHFRSAKCNNTKSHRLYNTHMPPNISYPIFDVQMLLRTHIICVFFSFSFDFFHRIYPFSPKVTRNKNRNTKGT